MPDKQIETGNDGQIGNKDDGYDQDEGFSQPLFGEFLAGKDLDRTDILLGKSFSLSEDVQYEIGVFINRYYLTNKRRS